MADEKTNKPKSQGVAPTASEPEASADQDAVEAALTEAQASIRELQQAAESTVRQAGIAPDIDAPDLSEVTGPITDEPPVDPDAIDLLGDVELQVMVELGRTQMMVEDVLRLGDGAVVELDKLAGDPVDVYVNNQLVARGEVLVLNDNFCIRISEIVADLEQQVEAAVRQEAAT